MFHTAGHERATGVWVELHIKYLGREMGERGGHGRRGRGKEGEGMEEEEGMEKEGIKKEEEGMRRRGRRNKIKGSDKKASALLLVICTQIAPQ